MQSGLDIRSPCARACVTQNVLLVQGMRKPDPACFQCAAEHLGVGPADLVLIDDRPPNVDAVRSPDHHYSSLPGEGNSVNLNAGLTLMAAVGRHVRQVSVPSCLRARSRCGRRWPAWACECDALPLPFLAL